MKKSVAVREDALIVQIVSRHAVRDQAALLAKLRQAGVTLAQATLSRRLRKLGVAKVSGAYCLAASSSHPNLVRDVRLAPPNLVVIHTPPGHAGPVADRPELQREFPLAGQRFRPGSLR